MKEMEIVATISGNSVEPLQLRNGSWRAYIRSECTPSNPVAFAYDKEVVRDNYGYIISGATKVALIEKLKTEYPNWKWDKSLFAHQ